jgi:transposase
MHLLAVWRIELCMSRPYGSAAELERRRYRAVEAVEQGERVKDVARILGVASSSVYRWMQMAQEADGLAARPHPGPTPRLSPQQQQQLEALLCQGAEAHGWPNRLWTTQRIADLVQRHFGVSWHHDHVGRFLRQRLDWTPQKPRRRARERDEAAILRWKHRQFPQIARRARERGAHLVFLDESGFMLTPTVRRTWAKRGQTPVLSCWDRRDRLSVISCVTVSPQAGHRNLYFEILPDKTNAHGEDIVAYLRQLKKVLGGPFTVIWDGSKIHSRSAVVQAYLSKHPEIQARTLPGYAPELNPDEGVWGWCKYGRLANLAAQNTTDLRAKVAEELDKLKCNPMLLSSFIQETGLGLAA